MNTQPILPLLLTLTLAGGALVRAQAPVIRPRIRRSKNGQRS